jgi:C4-type Zn-finger protein
MGAKGNLKGEGGLVSGVRVIGVVKESQVEERKCPECGSGNMRRSQMRGFWERGVLRTIGVRAYRCERCFYRYYESRLGKAKDEK